MSWRWEYVFAAAAAAPSAPPAFLAEVERKAEELVRTAEALHLHGRSHEGADPPGDDVIVRGGMFRYQIVVRSERVYIVQLTCMGR
ncbi:hypothetical protein EOT10_33205 [Streptomyces antnestii]|uniref:Type II toxin-antitoxin system RelE/ParE family toxin n=1 Tax=Streptomyces antnestii TaxID=2494256 RepID=A0A3S2XLU2_9ACTN|nr:hypothetical protein [Streptomyces sp. San01]RVU17959.1 hypothetical protein EOT10_33205 [Streptomyces sp. San01]